MVKKEKDKFKTNLCAHISTYPNTDTFAFDCSRKKDHRLCGAKTAVESVVFAQDYIRHNGRTHTVKHIQ